LQLQPQHHEQLHQNCSSGEIQHQTDLIKQGYGSSLDFVGLSTNSHASSQVAWQARVVMWLVLQ
jgi:hypothetical protein